MQPDKFTIKAAEAIQGAQQPAQQRGNPEVTPLHLLAALVSAEATGRWHARGRVWHAQA